MMPVRARLSLLLALTASIAACRASSGAASGGGAAQQAAPARPAEVTPANVALGDSLYNNGSCQRCHGKGGVGAQNGPRLDDNTWVQLPTGSYDEILRVIIEGVPRAAIKDTTRKNAMRPRGGPMNLDDAKAKAVAAYVWSISHR